MRVRTVEIQTRPYDKRVVVWAEAAYQELFKVPSYPPEIFHWTILETFSSLDSAKAFCKEKWLKYKVLH